VEQIPSDMLEQSFLHRRLIQEKLTFRAPSKPGFSCCRCPVDSLVTVARTSSQNCYRVSVKVLPRYLGKHVRVLNKAVDDVKCDVMYIVSVHTICDEGLLITSSSKYQ